MCKSRISRALPWLHFSLIAVACLWGWQALGEERFELAVTGSTLRSTAVLSNASLQIIHQGKTSTYARDKAYDVPGYIGYSSRSLRQAVRWPVSGTGAFQIGAITRGGTEFRSSTMRISSLPGRGPALPPAGAGLRGDANFAGEIDPAASYRLSNAALGGDHACAADKRGSISMAEASDAKSQAWRFVPVAGNAYRLINLELGEGVALTVEPRSLALSMQRSDAKSNYQVWKVAQSGKEGRFRITNVALGEAWAIDAKGGKLLVDRLRKGQSQLWILTRLSAPGSGLTGKWVVYNTADGRPRGAEISLDRQGGFTLTSADRPEITGRAVVARDQLTLHYQDGRRHSFRYVYGGGRIDFLDAFGRPEAFYWRRPGPPLLGQPLRPRLVGRKIAPGRPLEPVRVEFANSHEEELWLLVTDFRDPAHPRRLKIPPDSAAAVKLDRDPGIKIVEVWEIPTPRGVVVEERVVELPSRRLYDVCVYELFIQSIAIDRTPRGQGKIEEVNYSPKSVGAFPLPAGEQLQGGTIDAYAAAKAQRNPGGVRRIDPKAWQPTQDGKQDPIKRILENAQKP